jgi:hypothetical protein
MPLPEPRLGLVVRYGFVWAAPDRKTPVDSGKDRPCLIVGLRSSAEPALKGRIVTRATYLPMSRTPPRAGEGSLAIPARVAEHLGLANGRSFIYTTYAVEDDWPLDIAPLSGEPDRFHYGFIPPRLFTAVTTDFLNYLRTHPRFIHMQGS